MTDIAKEVVPVSLEDEMRQSYLDYAMSVIIGRALPDVRDGLKPVHRRVLYAMRELGNDWNKAYKKSARIVGDVIGKYHPHGDTAVYDAMVRLAQPFSLRYLLVDGQGNFGSVDGDAPAAMRDTEVRMSRLAHELIADLDKDTVDFMPNYDESEHEPVVFPTRVPNLLVNGASGIAVGMATNIPPHNLSEVLDACLALIDDAALSIDDLMRHVQGPDFPTAAIINGVAGIRDAYHTGRGRVVVRGRSHVEQIGNRDALVITELPYQVNKARLLEKIAELVKEKRIDGIAELRDESDKDGMRMVIELKRDAMPEIVLNNLYLHTSLQSVFSINTVVLEDGQPRLLNLKQILEAFLRHRREVVTRRTVYELGKARERAHVLEGLAVALANLDAIIELIRGAENPTAARAGLLARAWEPGGVTELLARAEPGASRPLGLAQEFGLKDDGYHLSEAQAQAILDLRLHRLTGLEQGKIHQEYQEILTHIAELLDILIKPGRLMEVIREEFTALKEQYGDARRTEILPAEDDLAMEDLIPPQDVVVTISHAGYAKTQPVTDYAAQRRGGRGKAAAAVREEDFIDKLFTANTHDTLLCFSSRGKVYWLNVYRIPLAGRGARGRPIANLLPLEEGERINALLPVREYDANHFLFMATAGATVKKTPLSEFSRPRTSGIIAVDLREGDQLVDVALTDGQRDVLLFSSGGKAMRFHESDVRAMGRIATGVRGMRLPSGERVIALLVADQGDVLIATQNGYGKRTALSEFPAHGRGGQGVIAIQTTTRNGAVVGAIQVAQGDELMLISSAGTLVRTRVAEISLVGRNTQGVRLINLGDGEQLVGIDRVLDSQDDTAVELCCRRPGPGVCRGRASGFIPWLG